MQNQFAFLGASAPKIYPQRLYFKFSFFLFFFYSLQIQAVETIAPAPPNWGLDPVTGTLLKPGISIMTQGTLIAPGPNDGDHALKMYDTSAIMPLNSRPQITPDIHTHHHWDVGSIVSVNQTTL